MDGDVELTTKAGYSVTLHLKWNADQPRTDVGSEPPGKTNIVIPASPFKATITNTTEGGRGLPTASWGEDYFVALYAGSSAVCTMMDDYGNRDNILQDASGAQVMAPPISGSGFCGVRLFQVLGPARAGGRLDLGATLSNDSPVDYTFGDLAASAARGVANGPSWAGVEEDAAEGLVDAISSPVAFGVAPYRTEPPVSKSCTYTDNLDETLYVALIESNIENQVPGC